MNIKNNRQRNYYRNGDIVYNDKRIKREGTSLLYEAVSNPSFTLNESNGNLYYTSTQDGGESYTKGVLTFTIDPFVYLGIDANNEMDLIANSPNILSASFELNQINGNFIINV